LIATGQFQFTPLREGRPSGEKKLSMLSRFQFTPLREGRRNRPKQYGLGQRISIHAPPRGATHGVDFSAGHQISIHAPPRGATAVVVICA